MRRGVILQKRDFDILQTVYEYTVASFQQLKDKHFGDTILQAASNRMNRLVKANYLKSYRVGLVIYQGEERRVNKVFVVTTLGLQALCTKLKCAGLKLEVIHPQFYSLVHDLLLNEVLENLKKENGDQKIVNSKLLKITRSRTDQVPDLVVQGDDAQTNQAIELELTAKSEKRYREIITNYRLSNRWRKILFIVRDDSIQEKIIRAITGERIQGMNQNNTFGKFQIRKLTELLSESKKSSVLSETKETRIA